MAENEEISLKTKLQNILNEKGTKLIPENIKNGTTILGVTGTYSNDATATSSDVMEKKTFYNANGRQTGNIVGIYRNAEIPKLANSLGSYNTKLQDISYNNNLAVGINQSDNTLEIYDITNDGIDYNNPTVFTITDLNCTKIMQARFALENLDNDTVFLWVLDGVNDTSKIINRYNLSISNKTISNRVYLTKSVQGGMRGDYIAPRPHYVYDIGFAYAYGRFGVVISDFEVYRLTDDTSSTLYNISDRGTKSWGTSGLGASGYILWSNDGEYVEYSIRANANASNYRTVRIINMIIPSVIYSMFEMPQGDNKKILLGEYVIQGNQLYKLNDINTVINTMQVSLPSTYPLNRYYAIKNFIFVDNISTIDVYRLQDYELELVETITTNNMTKNQGYQYGSGYTPDNQSCTYICPDVGYFYVNSDSKIYGFLEGVHGQLIGLIKNNTTYYNGYDATASQNDVIANKTYYGKNGKTKGSITPITEANGIDYISLDLQSSDIVAVDYANKCCVKRISDTGLEFYQFNGDGIIEDSKIEMTIGEASAGTILKAYSFSNYSDNDGYVWLYTASIKRTGYNDEPGKKIYINVFRIDIENQTYDVFGNVSAKLTEYATSQTGGHYLKIAPRPNKNQFCVCGWLNDVSSGTYGTWVSLLINVTTSNTVTITRYTGIDTGRQSDASNQYVRCYYSSNGEYLYLNGEFSVWNSDNRVICYGVLQMSETNTVLSTIKSYSKRMKESAYDGGPTPLGLYTTYVMQGESIYNVSDLENPIATDVLPFDTTRNRNVFVLNKYILYVSGANLNVYEFNPNDLTVTLYDTRVFDGSITNMLPISEKQVVYFYNNSVKGYIMTDDVIITGLVRNGKTFLDIAHYDLPANMAVQGYKFANSSGAQVGTMPNNGALSYNPSTSQQTIPAGYTSGGTIDAVTSAIDANIVAENIKSGITVLGVTGTYDNGVAEALGGEY